jgi:branched-chain amino acid transport system ATP-binding protein
LEIIGVIKSLESSNTVLIVDHDMELVFEVAQRIIVLHYGEIIADGTPDEIESNKKVREIYMGIE